MISIFILKDFISSNRDGVSTGYSRWVWFWYYCIFRWRGYHRQDGLRRGGVLVRVSLTMIENLPPINVDLPNILLSRLPTRDSYIVSSLTSPSGNYASKPKAIRNWSTINKIKDLLADYSSPNQQLLAIKSVLKCLIFKSGRDQYLLINIDNESSTIVQFFFKKWHTERTIYELTLIQDEDLNLKVD